MSLGQCLLTKPMHWRGYLLVAAMLVGVLFLPCAGAEATESGVLSLQQALTLAQRHSPALRIDQHNVEMSAANVQNAASTYWPQITAGAEYSRSYYSNGLASQKMCASGQTHGCNLFDFSLKINQNIFDFGKRYGRVDEVKAQLRASSQTLLTAAADLRLNVYTAFYNVLLQRTLVEVYKKDVATRSLHARQALTKFRAGVVPKVDIAKAEADVASAKVLLIQSRFALRQARVALETVMGVMPMQGQYILENVAPEVPLPDPIEQLYEQAVLQRPEFKGQQALIAAAAAKRVQAISGYFPALGLEGLAQYENVEFPLIFAVEGQVTLTWNLFAGLATQSSAAEARAERLRETARLDQLKLQIHQQVVQAYLALSYNIETIAASEIGVRYSKENLELARGRYDAGVGDAVEFSDAAWKYTVASRDLAKATFGALTASAQLERAVGKGLKSVAEGHKDTAQSK